MGRVMTKHWIICLRGKLVARKLTRIGAQSLAFQLMKNKGWDQKDIEVKEDVF